ncbi:4-hydroxy-tetrahydrodipicolinate synthase [Paenarthrobacter sp. NPDC092416]|uniref:4-hydroxy-tetrahydrodipicolinate synthase n=1 Tax=Paenarthrobacter sp. NPDC092416 TaxID=3364386 RepID=UPI00380FAE8B
MQTLVSSPFGSLLTAMVTPFTPDGKVDLDRAASLAEYLIGEGNDGVVVCGTAGEASTLGDQEKEDLVRVVKETLGERALVIAGTGTNDTSRSIEMAKRAAKAGADGQLVVTPYYNKPTQAGVFDHFTRIAAATNMPVMLYDIPGRAGIAISGETFERLADNPQIVAVKDAKADFSSMMEILRKTRLAVYAGDDALAFPWLSAGAAGVVSVSANAAPRHFRQMVDALRTGAWLHARKINVELTPLIRAVMDHVPAAVSAKLLLNRQGRLPCNVVRSPLSQPLPTEIAGITTELLDTQWALA